MLSLKGTKIDSGIGIKSKFSAEVIKQSHGRDTDLLAILLFRSSENQNIHDLNYIIFIREVKTLHPFKRRTEELKI